MRSGEKGTALVWALLLLLFAGALGVALLDRGRAVDAATKTDLLSLKALYAAEGGLALARHRLASDPAYAGETLRVGECEVTVRVEKQDAGWVVRSSSGGRAIEALLRAGHGLPAIHAYFPLGG